jgi:hypothetical protein
MNVLPLLRTLGSPFWGSSGLQWRVRGRMITAFGTHPSCYFDGRDERHLWSQFLEVVESFTRQWMAMLFDGSITFFIIYVLISLHACFHIHTFSWWTAWWICYSDFYRHSKGHRSVDSFFASFFNQSLLKASTLLHFCRAATSRKWWTS